VFKKKTDNDENVHIYKAGLVAKGFKQIHGINYDETFSPVVMLKSVRILLAIAAYFNYEIWQMDLKMTFINGNLTEDVYMTQPEGFVDPKYVGKICKLQKSIYGIYVLMKWSKGLASSRMQKNLVFIRLVGAQLYFWSFRWMTYC
jgi:hypothetical protein